MKKGFISLFIIVSIIMSIFSFNMLTVSAATITEESFATKISELKNTFKHGEYWNWYSASDYSHTGTKKCYCSGTCKGSCSCSCGQFYYNGVWKGGQCHGYALKLGYLIFGSVANNWSKHYNAYNVYAGDVIRINSDNHSIFVYKVDGNTIYYTDCNATGPCQVNWNGSMTKASLASKLTYVLHNSSYQLSGTGEKKEVINPVHADTAAHVRNGFFTLKNVSSGKYMNVYGGVDTNQTKVTMWTYDDSTDQQFNIIHKVNGKYKLYAVCSSNGTNRVVDVYRGTSVPAAGNLVDLWTPDDDTSQYFYIVPLSDGSYVFELAAKDGYVIAPSSASEANTNGSQLTLQKYTGASYQKWKLCNNNGKETYAIGSYAPGSYRVDTNGVVLRMRSSASTSASQITTVSDGTVLNVTNISSNWGYTTYNGYSGWVCLDFTVYTPTISSISVHSTPYIIQYFVGQSLDTDGLTLNVTYSNGSTQKISSGYTTKYDFNSTGTKTVTVSYSGYTTTFDVNVQEVSALGISLSSNALKNEYYVGDKIDTTGLSLLVSYNDNTTKTITSGFTTEYDFSTAGTKTVTVSYGGQTTSYNVEVSANTSNDIPKIEVSSEKCYSGTNVTVDVKLTSNDVYDGNMIIEYNPSKVVVIDAEECGALSGRQVAINTEYDSNKIKITFAGTTPIKSDGTIIKLIFKVFDRADGDAEVTIADYKLYNKLGEVVTAVITNGKIDITEVANSADITNVQSVDSDGKKIVTADISSDKVICYLVAYKDGALVECDRQYPINGKVELSVENIPNAQFKFMVWNAAMKPLMDVRNIY